jgi:hypothetical protein
MVVPELSASDAAQDLVSSSTQIEDRPYDRSLPCLFLQSGTPATKQCYYSATPILQTGYHGFQIWLAMLSQKSFNNYPQKVRGFG